MKIWLFQTGEPLHIDRDNPRPMRAMNLANALVDRGHDVVLWSSNFYHQEKRLRFAGNRSVQISKSLEIRLVDSPGYKKNIGFGRIWDHIILANNLKKLLEEEKTCPDVAFVGYPPIESAAVMTKWLAERKIPCMVDVKDQWPIIFIDALPIYLKPFGRVAFAPYFYYGRRALRNASALTAMADGFLHWAARFSGRDVGNFDRVVPLTSSLGSSISNSDLLEADSWWCNQGIYDDGTPRICFIGSHSSAFDMEPVFQAAKSMASIGKPFQFLICGSGENTSAWKQRARKLPNVYFPGWLDRAKIEVLAYRSTAGLAPYNNRNDFALSVPNKVIDYLSLGLPVLSPLYGEVRSLISEFDVGLSYGSVTGKTLESCIDDLLAMPDLRKKLSDNASKLFENRFSFEAIYGGLVQHLELLANRPCYD